MENQFKWMCFFRDACMKRGDVYDVEMDIQGRGIWLYTILC